MILFKSTIFYTNNLMLCNFQEADTINERIEAVSQTWDDLQCSVSITSLFLNILTLES